MFRAALSALLLGTAAAEPLLWPQPASLSFGDAAVSLAKGANGTFFYSTTESALLERAFRRFEALLFDGREPCAAPALTSFRVEVADAAADLQLGANESYELSLDSADAGGAVARAATVWGALRALETVSQLLAPGDETSCARVACAPVAVADAPRFAHRGLMIDSARHYLPVDTITCR